MKIQKAAGALGAYVTEIDLAEVVNNTQLFEQVQAAAVEHEVLFFREQHIGPALFQKFAQTFGAISDHPAYAKLADAPQVQVLESTADNPSKIEVWHSDMTFTSEPPSFTLLHGQVIPAYGGDTLWSSTTAAYEGLSEPMQNLFAGMQAMHDFRHGFQESLAEPGGRERLAATVAQNPPIAHPLIRTHPTTGIKSIYVNALFTTHIIGVAPAESRALLSFLYEHIVRAEFTVRLNWAPKTIAMWDNRSTQHKPINDFFPQHRLMHRVTICGDRPVYKEDA